MHRTNRILRGLLLAAFLGTLASPALADQPQDAWITTKVKMALLEDDSVPGLGIDVDTYDGQVTLHGQVASAAEKAQAENRTKGIQGVTDVRNLLAVVPETERRATEATDEALAERVAEALEEDEALEDSSIEVSSVNDGVVVLSGEAATLSAHRRALEDAQSVAGVRRVASEIRSPDELADAELWEEGTEAATVTAGQSASDVWTTTKAKVLLMREPGLSPLAINVDTYRGVVTLFGTVGTQDAKERAGKTVAQIQGVASVENELQVVPDVAANRVEAQDEQVLAAVEKRIAERSSLGDADIDVEVSDRVVRLTGTVSSQGDRLTALTVARSTAGVDSVIDDLKLQQPQS